MMPVLKSRCISVKLPAHRAGLPGNEISFSIVPLDPAYKAGLAGHLPVNRIINMNVPSTSYLQKSFPYPSIPETFITFKAIHMEAWLLVTTGFPVSASSSSMISMVRQLVQLMKIPSAS